MNSNLALIKALATTLITELDSLEIEENGLNIDGSFRLDEKVKEFETKLIKLALIKTGGNQRNAARLLGVKNSTLHNKIKTYKVEVVKLNAPALPIEQKEMLYSH